MTSIHSHSYSSGHFSPTAAFHRPSGLLNPSPHSSGSWAGSPQSFGPPTDGLSSGLGKMFSVMSGALGLMMAPALVGMFTSPLGLLAGALGTILGGDSGAKEFPAYRPTMPSPHNFWPGSGSNVHNQEHHWGTRSHTFGGHHSSNGQFNSRGHAFQTMNNGVGTYNRQVSTGRSAFQQVQSGYGSRNQQSALGRSTQRINTNGGALNRQVHSGWGRGRQVARSNGSHSSSGQLSTSRSGVDQKVVHGHNSNSVQVANAQSNSTQIAHAKGGSNIAQSGGRKQTAHLVGQQGTIVQQGSHRGAEQLATTRGNSNIAQIGGRGRDAQETRVHGNNNQVVMNSGSNRDHNASTITGKNNKLVIEGDNNVNVVNDAGKNNKTTFRNTNSVNQVNYNDWNDSKKFRVGHGLGNHNVVNTKGGDDNLTVDVSQRENHHSLDVNMGSGNDRTHLTSGPKGNASMTFDGGTGQDAFQYSGGADVTIRQGDRIIQQGTKDGGSIDLSNYENFEWVNKDGEVTRRLDLSAQ